MPKVPYQWRHLSLEDRLHVLHKRLARKRPWHSPPHKTGFATTTYHITAACYEHAPHIGHTPERMDSFAESLLTACQPHVESLHAWCLLPNHYHLLLSTNNLRNLLDNLSRLHGRSSFNWNGEESTRGRTVFYRASDRAMRSERHYFATLNYVHHNPVHHGYVSRWDQWPWSSAAQFLAKTDRAEAERIWTQYPIDNYGQGWDDADL